MKQSDLAALTVVELIDRFRNAAAAHGAAFEGSNHRKVNRLYDEACAAEAEIKARGPEATELVAPLLAHSDQSVRFWAATLFLESSLERALPVLAEIGRGEGLVAFSAGLVFEKHKQLLPDAITPPLPSTSSESVLSRSAEAVTAIESKAPVALTRAIIDAADDDDVELLLLNYVISLQRLAPERLDTLPVACQAHFVAFTMDGEVLNGGFNQLWFNSPDCAADAEQALRFLDMPEAAELARQAAIVYESIEHRHRAARDVGTAEAFIATYEGSPFEKLDEAYDLRQNEWRDARIRYIRANVDAFVHRLEA